MAAVSKQQRRDERRTRMADRVRSGDLVPDTESEAFKTIVDAVETARPVELTGKSRDEKRAILDRMLRSR
ncbi:MAG: hypothetical protein ACFE0R_07825 [Salinarimonas sp.]